jgi:FkbM family methyltransferase
MLTFLRRTIIPPLWETIQRVPGGVRIWQWWVKVLHVPPPPPEPTPLEFRPGTTDANVYHQVYTLNEYRLPHVFKPDDILVDIGAHIGSFCYAALKRGAQHIYAFEPDQDNYGAALRNLHSFGERVQLRNQAIWRSDMPVQHLTLVSADNNPAGIGFLWSDRADVVNRGEIEAIGLDEVLLRITQGGQRRVRLLKIDCEVSEFPILFTARRLDLVNAICGEFHELSGPYNPMPIPDHFKVPGHASFTIEELGATLQQAGFKLTYRRNEQGYRHLGMFWASRS